MKENKTFETLRSGQLRCLKCDSLFDQDSCEAIESLITKEKSLSLFRALPKMVRGEKSLKTKGKKKNKRPRFRALSLYDTETSYVGETQEARRNAFERAIEKENIPRFRILFNLGVDLDERDEYGMTALMRACLNDSNILIDALLCAGADVNLKANDGTSALEIMNLRKMTRNKEEEDVVIRPISIIRPKEYPGTIVIDGGFSKTFLNRLLNYYKTLPGCPPGKVSCTTRRYLYDFDESICNTIQNVFSRASGDSTSFAFRKFRVLSYEHVDGFVPPHVDLSRTYYEIFERTSKILMNTNARTQVRIVMM